ncbi:MAG: SxtJ family membrane protein [Bacillota bacterium]
MILEEIKNISSSKKDLRKFGLSVGIVFGLTGLLIMFKSGGATYPYFLAAAALLVIPALVFPGMLKPLQKFWMGLAIILGWFSTRIILSLLYYLVITPTGVIMKLRGKDLLDEKIEKGKTSYWNLREVKPYDPKESERQF